MKKLLIPFLILFVYTFSTYANTIVVAQDGTGNFKTVQDAINSVSDANPDYTIIFIQNGVYNEKIVLPATKCNIILRGENMYETVISYNDYAALNNMGTFKTYTFMIAGNDITVENLTIENTAGQVGQAVALHTEGDRLVFRNCRLLGNQDTVYTGGKDNVARLYFENCHIEGTTDFIFGPATAWFETCTINCKRNSYITAASTPESSPYGYIFNYCNVTMDNDATSVYLGRPWRPYAMVLFMNTELPKEIKPLGWHNWGKESNEETARYLEYNNSGEGADTANRVKWSKVLTDKEAKAIVDGFFSDSFFATCK